MSWYCKANSVFLGPFTTGNPGGVVAAAVLDLTAVEALVAGFVALLAGLTGAWALATAALAAIHRIKNLYLIACFHSS
jgi:hypothetical protein